MSKEIKETLESAEQLKDSFEQLNHSESALEVDNIDWAVKSHLYGSVKEVLENKVKYLVEPDYVVRYIALVGPQLRVSECGEKLAKFVNKACRAYNALGQLGNFIKMDLHYTGKGEPNAIYLAYIAFTPEAAEMIDEKLNAGNKQFFAPEGGLSDIEFTEKDFEEEQ